MVISVPLTPCVRTPGDSQTAKPSSNADGKRFIYAALIESTAMLNDTAALRVGLKSWHALMAITKPGKEEEKTLQRSIGKSTA